MAFLVGKVVGEREKRERKGMWGVGSGEKRSRQIKR